MPKRLAPHRSALVQGRHHLRGPRPRLQRQQRRRHRRFRRPHREARLPAGPGRHGASGCCRFILRRCATTATTSPTTPSVNPDLRHARRLSSASSTRPIAAACASSPSWCSTTPPTSIRGFSARAVRRRAARERDFYVWSDTPDKYHDARIIFKDFEPSNWTWDPVAKAYYWHRFYSHQPDLEFRQSGGARGRLQRRRLLARAGRRRPAARRRSLSLRARGHQLRKPAGDARLSARSCARTSTSKLPEPHAAGRSQPVARGRRRLLRRRRRMPHGVPLPADAADVHGDADGRPLSDRRHPGADAGHSRELPVGAVPAQPRRTDAGDGHRRGARLHVSRLRPGPAGADQPRHPPPAGAAAGQQPPQDRADEWPAVLAAGHAGHLLRRRNRHGRQHLSRRSQRRAHADAVERRSQRRLLARQSAAAVSAGRSSIPNITTRRSMSRRSRTIRIRCCGG